MSRSGPVEPQVREAVRQLLQRHPDADPVLVCAAVMDAVSGLDTFGFRGDERSTDLITRMASADPRLGTPADADARLP